MEQTPEQLRNQLRLFIAGLSLQQQLALSVMLAQDGKLEQLKDLLAGRVAERVLEGE